MPRGLPDYYNPDTLVSQRLANVEELATLLRGIADSDNRGRTLWHDHFENGLNGWFLTNAGDGEDPVASIDHAEIEPASMKMDSGTDGGGGTCHADKIFRIHNLKKAGLEFSYAHYNDSAELQVIFAWDNGTNYIWGRIDIDQLAKKIYIYDGLSATEVADLPTASTVPHWLTIKLVIDFVTPTYERLIIGQDEIDISAYSPYEASPDKKGLLIGRFLTDALDDGDNIAYVGHVTFTIDEP